MFRAWSTIIIACILSQIAETPALAGGSIAVPSPAVTPAVKSQVRSEQTSGATASNPETARVAHLLNRITFGPRPGDIEAVQRMGITNFIEQQLHPDQIRESPEVLDLEARTSVGRTPPAELLQQFQEIRRERKQAQINAAKMKIEGGTEFPAGGGQNQAQAQMPAETNGGKYLRQSTRQYAALKLMRAIDSPRQLQQVMTEFWYNHFNVWTGKGPDRLLALSYEEQAIRPNALGNFRQLLGATCHHSAMLFYLDNWQNTAPDSPGAQGRFKGLNENYARELMELHTLGVDGGYTQKDVVELARILTGLGLKRPGRPGRDVQLVGNSGAVFAAKRHDFGDKTLLGTTIRGSGEDEIERALDLLASNPATAHHISYQLAQYFVADDPPKALVDRMASRFLRSNGDIKSVLREMFSSPEFWSPQYEQAKYKTPLRYAVSAVRICDGHPDAQGMNAIMRFLQTQGEPLYGCLTPDGYKNTKAAWLNPDSLIGRINIATAIGAGRMPDVVQSAPDYKTLLATLSAEHLSSKTLTAASNAPAALRAPALLGSPEFMHY